MSMFDLSASTVVNSTSDILLVRQTRFPYPLRDIEDTSLHSQFFRDTHFVEGTDWKRVEKDVD